MDILVKRTLRPRRWGGVAVFACLVGALLWLERRAEAPPVAAAPLAVAGDASFASAEPDTAVDSGSFHSSASTLMPHASGAVRLNLHEAAKDSLGGATLYDATPGATR
jgi:hypothetical protein